MKPNRAVKALVAVIASLAMVFAGGTASNAAKKSSLTIGSVINIISWDPTAADIGHLLPYYQGVYDNLILRAPDGSFKPNLATAWKWNDSQTTFTLTLRTGVKFTNGEVLNAAAVKKNLDAFIKGNGPQSSSLAGVTVDVVNPTTVRLNMNGTYNPSMEYYLSTTDSFIAAPSLVGTASLKTTPVGSGPYVLDSSSVAGSSIVLKKNAGYWDKSKQKFDTITFKILADTTARLNALLSGQIDATLLDVKTASTAKSRGFIEYRSNVDWKGLLLMDRAGTKNEALGKVAVRQAIAYAVDRAALNKAVEGGYGEITNQVFGKASGGYDAALDKTYPRDVAKAKALLASAGYANGVTIDMPGWPDPTLQAVLKDQLAEANINVNWVQVPAADFRNQMKSGKYAAGVFQIFQGTGYVAAVQLADPNGSWNVLHSKDKFLTDAIAAMKHDTSASNLNKQAKAINTYLTKQAWYVPFYRIPQLFSANKSIKVVSQAQNAVPYLYNYSPSGK